MAYSSGGQAAMLQHCNEREQVIRVQRFDDWCQIGCDQRLHQQRTRLRHINLAEPDFKGSAKDSSRLQGQLIEENLSGLAWPRSRFLILLRIVRSSGGNENCNRKPDRLWRYKMALRSSSCAALAALMRSEKLDPSDTVASRKRNAI
ncbi:MAG: hypothetical protein IPG76_22350 [Acidobacteria bacterium]|nr:hypothetical protein [Acidobacteriota bacterium]